MDVKKMAVFGLIAVSVLLVAAPASAWFGPFGCGLGFGFAPFGCGFPFFARAVPVPVPVPVAAPLCAPGIGLGGCGVGAPGLGLGGCGIGAAGIGLGGIGSGLGFNSPFIPGPR